jgi:hypothetical protein
MDTPSSYEIRIEGHLSRSWSSWFEGLTICQEESGETVLSGKLADQAALHGVLMRIRDLGLPLVAVNRIQGADAHDSGDQPMEEGQR